MENKKQGYMGTLVVKIKEEKSETCAFDKIPFPKDLSVKMFDKKSFIGFMPGLF